MSYLGGNAPSNMEAWELEEGRYISSSIGSLTHRQKMRVMLSVGLVTAIEISSRLSVNVLLPDMQGNVAADSDQISYVVILYNLGFLCSLALAYWMTRVIGSRRHLLLCIGLYSIGAVGCVLSAHSLETLLISRLIMGFGGGAFLVRVVILAGLMFPGKARIHAVTYLYSLLFAFQITYPIVMGWIDDTFHWNYAFLLDLPFLAIGAVMVWKFVPRGHLFLRNKEARVDFTGAILLIVSLGCLQLATSRGERDDWFDSSWISISLIVSVITLALFFWWDSRVQNVSPVFHLRMIWRQGAIRTSFSVVLIVGAILGAGLFVIPQYLRTVQDYSAMQTGAFISMFTAGLGSGLIVSLRILVPKLGGPLAIATGLLMLLATFSAIAYIWTPTTPTHILAIAILLQGFSLAPALLGAANIATGSALPADLNDVSTMFFFVRQLGNTLGVSAATVTFDRRLNLHSARLLDVANRLDPTVHSTLGTYSNLIHRNGGGGANPALGALQLFQNNVIIQSRLLSYIDIYVGLAVLGALGLIVLAFTKFKNRLGPHSFHLW